MLLLAVVVAVEPEEEALQEDFPSVVPGIVAKFEREWEELVQSYYDC